MRRSESPREITIVNATAIVPSGASVLLLDFLNEYSASQKGDVIVFVNRRLSASISSPIPGVSFVVTRAKDWPRRVLWDLIGLRLWISRHKYRPSSAISFQNTGFRSMARTKFVYLHQSLPFVTERRVRRLLNRRPLMRFYTTFYLVYLRLTIGTKCRVITQSEWLKHATHQRLRLPLSRIEVLRPSLSQLPKSISRERSASSPVWIIYPATWHPHKNHELLLRSLESMRADKDGLNNIRLVLTTSRSEIARKTLEKYSAVIEQAVVFVGMVSHQKVLSMLQYADALAFPSLAESFGLPLLEAAAYGKPIFCTDRPWARETLGAYQGVLWLSPFDHAEWASAFRRFRPIEYPPFSERPNGWSKLISDITSARSSLRS